MPATFAAVLRATFGLVAAALALANPVPQAGPVFGAAVAGGCLFWSLSFGVLTLRGGFWTPLVVVDLLLTAAAALCLGWLVPAPLAGGADDWVAVLALVTVTVAGLAWRARPALATAALVAVCYALGAGAAGDPATGLRHAGWIVAQAACVATLGTLARRARATGAGQAEAYRLAAARAAVEGERRARERDDDYRRYADALSTLAVVGLGGVAAEPRLLRDRAAVDVLELQRPVDAPPEPRHAVAPRWLVRVGDG